MRQLAFVFAEPRRIEQPVSRWSWVDTQGVRQFRIFYPCCIDFSWPWWRPEALPQ